VFYAFQPYLLELFGEPDAIYLSGIAAALFAIAQIAGGSSVGLVRKYFRSRTSVIVGEIVLGSAALVFVGLAQGLDQPWGFWVAIVLLAMTALLWALSGPMQQAYMNEVIPSEQRATVLSFASLMGSAGGVVSQPALGRVADVYSRDHAVPTVGRVVGCWLMAAAMHGAEFGRQDTTPLDRVRGGRMRSGPPRTTPNGGCVDVSR
jgi:MFS family permease